ncbi:MAG: hypothetical protein AWM53_00839 [Candidatus Dichloromethanomonas elyunquensis]|nr:MAG: hypothetical protein AWM53_00839 [Candidatus Dichloromethanomonas elyunquensis]
MGNKLIPFLRNFSYALSSNAVSFLVNALILLTIPKAIGVTEYGYFQYYTLLASYLFVLHFGWNDGIYLRHSGNQYHELNRQVLSQQFWGIVIFSLGQTAVYLSLLGMMKFDPNKFVVFLYAILSVILVLPRIFISVILQVSNKMKEYSVLLITERVLYALILALMLICGVRNFKILLLGDLAGKVFSLIYGLKRCSAIILTRPVFSSKTLIEIKDNIGSGIFLALSNIFSLLITGIVQFFIENRWNIETFSKVSLAFNISRMLMVVINSVSIVMFPLIKNVKNIELLSIYHQIRKAAMIILMAFLVFYYPLRIVLTMWLPQYADSFKYVALILPMCVFESKSAMLVSTYLKALRKETILFKANLAVVMISLSFSYAAVYLISSLDLAVFLITVLLMIKSVLLEYFVSKVIPIQVSKDIVIELFMVLVFIGSNWFVQSWSSCFLYMFVYTIYLLKNWPFLRGLKFTEQEGSALGKCK